MDPNGSTAGEPHPAPSCHRDVHCEAEAGVHGGQVIDQDKNTRIDPFGALDALQYITFLSIGYLVGAWPGDVR